MKNFSLIAQVIGCTVLVVGLVAGPGIAPAAARTSHHRTAAPHHHLTHSKRPLRHRAHRRPAHHAAKFRRPLTARHRAVVSPTPTAILTVVTHADAGFTPNRLMVPVGTTVTFVNSSGQPVWVASNPHPTHTDYPGFDAGRPYGQGESYTFTFTRGGTFGYHNHLNPGQGGSIVVE